MTAAASTTTVAMTLREGADPIGGWLSDGRHQAPFDGWLDLITLLRRLAAGGGIGPEEVGCRSTVEGTSWG